MVTCYTTEDHKQPSDFVKQLSWKLFYKILKSNNCLTKDVIEQKPCNMFLDISKQKLK